MISKHDEMNELMSSTDFSNNYSREIDNFEDEEEEALILKEVSEEDAEEAFYDIVEDEKELTAVAAIFEELLEDLELVTQDWGMED